MELWNQNKTSFFLSVFHKFSGHRKLTGVNYSNLKTEECIDFVENKIQDLLSFFFTADKWENKRIFG